MKTYKLTKQNILQRVKAAEQSSLNVIEPLTLDNLSKLPHSLRSLLNGGRSVSLIVIPVAGDPK